jgi:tripartite-type tricarboxylate transporter receptor subunit TctC
MKMSTQVLAAFVLSLLAAYQAIAAPDYPARPVTIILPAGPGGGPDVIARLVAERLGQNWGQPVMILNRPGGSGLIGAQAASAAKPDGYTLYLPIASTFTILPHSHEKLPLDLERDLRPIGLVGEQPMVIAVSGALGVNTLSELIALAQKRAGELTWGTTRGGVSHMTMALFTSRAGLAITHVPFTASRQAVNELIAGRLSVISESVAAVSGMTDPGPVKVLAVTSASRLADYPDVPTVAEFLPGFQARGWTALMAPSATPDAVVHKVSEDLRAVLDQPDIRQKFQTLGTYPRPLTPTELAEFIRAEQQLWAPVVKRLGASLQ